MGWLKKLFHSREYNEIDDIEQKINAERRLMLKQRLARLKNLREEEKLRQEEADLETELGEYEEDDEEEAQTMPETPEALMMTLINSALAGKKSSSEKQNTLVSSSSLPASPKISDEELKSLKTQIPKTYLKIAKKMNDEQLSNQIKKQIGEVDEETIKRAIKIIRE